MKRIFVLLLALSLQTISYATLTPAPPVLKASSVMVPLGNTGKKISLQELSVISAQDLEELTGKKMKWADRMTFKMAQRELRHSISADGTIENKKLQKLALKAEGGSGFHVGGFVLGLLIGLIGVLIAYLINDDKKKARVKWAWIGWAVWVGLVILFYAL